MAAASYVAFESSAGSNVVVHYDDVTLVVGSVDLHAGSGGLSITVTYTKNNRTQSATLAPNTSQTFVPNRTISLAAEDPGTPGALTQADFGLDIEG